MSSKLPKKETKISGSTKKTPNVQNKKTPVSAKKAPPKKERTVEDFLAEHDDFETTDNGRIRCTTTGHELLPDLGKLEQHIKGSTYMKAQWYSHDFSQYEEQFIIPHNRHEKKMYCVLTSQELNKIPSQIENYIKGKKYQNALKKKKEADAKKAELEAKRAEKLQKKIEFLRQRKANGLENGETPEEVNDEELEDSGYEDEDEEMDDMDEEDEQLPLDVSDMEEEEEEPVPPKKGNQKKPKAQAPPKKGNQEKPKAQAPPPNKKSAKNAKPQFMEVDEEDDEEAEQFSSDSSEGDAQEVYLDESEEGMPMYRTAVRPKGKTQPSPPKKQAKQPSKPQGGKQAPAKQAQPVKQQPKAEEKPKMQTENQKQDDSRKRPANGKPQSQQNGNAKKVKK
eukprot:TRINITY_DN1761_c0_g1_i1.p1 TRINITY_DN1761_c0_g1~~TRINITY_DN1761_c0_g1_i1.p1  ORF type:complete len:409 (-),score=150.46 TRINITY_DN1761_c0_g1_i1:21-1202(-)